MFVSEARGLPYSGALEKCFTRRGSGFPANIGLGWKGLPGTNVLSYYKNSLLMTVKSFITMAPTL
jgi:hypothetical protein